MRKLHLLSLLLPLAFTSGCVAAEYSYPAGPYAQGGYGYGQVYAPRPYNPAPVQYYAPQPRYYAPPVRTYAPPPRYYAPPAYGYAPPHAQWQRPPQGRHWDNGRHEESRREWHENRRG